MKRGERKIALRCAVYTRVSTESGLEQDFNSLDNQREASEAYIKSQAHEGWKLVRECYDDGGFSGGSFRAAACRRAGRAGSPAGPASSCPCACSRACSAASCASAPKRDPSSNRAQSIEFAHKDTS